MLVSAPAAAGGQARRLSLLRQPPAEGAAVAPAAVDGARQQAQDHLQDDGPAALQGGQVLDGGAGNLAASGGSGGAAGDGGYSRGR